MASNSSKDTPPGVYFIHGPCWGVGSPPHGAAYVSAYLQKTGFNVTVKDLNLELYNRLKDDHEHLWKQESYRIWELNKPFHETLLPLFKDWLDEVEEKIVEEDPRVACFSINVASVIFSVHLARRLKRRIPWLVTIFGGTQCRFGVGNLRLPPGLFAVAQGEPGLVDAVVLGEGEVTCAALVRLALAGKPLIGVPGAVTLQDGFFGNFTPRPPVKDLDRLGFPTFEGYPVPEYRDNHLPVLLSRGCRYSCTFCNERLQYPEFRSRSGLHVFQEVARNQNRYGVRAFHFCDLVVNGNPERLAEYANLMTSSRRPSDWCGQAVIHPGLDDELLAKLKASGCDNLIFGIETFSPKISKLMGKPYPPEQADLVLRACRRNGVGTVINIIVGYPGETEVEFQETLDGLRRNAGNIDMVSSVSECHVPPGSILEQRCKEYGLKMPSEDGFMLWSIPGNDHNVRMERMAAVLDLLKELDLGYFKTTRYNETLEENLQQESAVNIVPDMMTTSAGPDRSAAAFSFISTSAEESGPEYPSAWPKGTISQADPGEIYSPLTPAPEPYYLIGQGQAQVRLGGRGVDIFHEGRLISRGGGFTARITLGKDRVLGSEGGIWCHVLEKDHVLAWCRWNEEPKVLLYMRIGPLDLDRFVIGAWLDFQDGALPHGAAQEVDVQLGLHLYNQLGQVTVGDEDLGPTRLPVTRELPGGISSMTLSPKPGAAVQAAVTLDLGSRDEAHTLTLEDDCWLEGIHASLGARLPLERCAWRAELSVASIGQDGETEEHPEILRTPALVYQDDHPHLETLEQPVFVSRVQLLSPDISDLNRDGIFVPPGGQLTVRGWLFCRDTSVLDEDTMFRVQIHPSVHETGTLVGVNNLRQEVPLVLEEGCFTRVDLVLERINLAPGSYKLSVAVAPGEGADHFYSFHECCYDLHVTGDAGRATGLIWPPEAGLSALDGTESPELRERAKGLSVASLYPLDHPEAICMAAGPGAPLELEIALDGRSHDPEEQEELQVRLFSLFPSEILVSFPLPLPPGTHARLALRLGELNVLEGDHRLEVFPAGRAVDCKALTVHVRQERGQGGGLIYCPYHTEVELLPKPPALETLGGQLPHLMIMKEDPEEASSETAQESTEEASEEITGQA